MDFVVLSYFQKWEVSKSPAVLKTVFLADEVSRKRELFEKEQEGSEKSHVFSKQVMTTLVSGKKSFIFIDLFKLILTDHSIIC